MTMIIKKEVVEVLKNYGFEIICQSPFEIEYLETGDIAKGVCAKYVVEAILEEKKKNDEHTKRLDAFGRLS